MKFGLEKFTGAMLLSQDVPTVKQPIASSYRAYPIAPSLPVPPPLSARICSSSPEIPSHSHLLWSSKNVGSLVNSLTPL